MNFSVRDLAVVTAYAALILSKSEALTVLVITASIAALLIIGIVFGLTTLAAIHSPRLKASSLRASSPLLLIIVIWCIMLALVRALLPEHTDSVARSMLLSLAGASIPLLLNMESRGQAFNDQTMWIGYWSLCSALAVGGLSAMALHQLFDTTRQAAGMDVFRWSTVIAMVASVFVTWWLLSFKWEPEHR